MQPGQELGRLVRDLVVIPRRGGEAGQREEEAVLGAGIAIGAVGGVVEAEDLREEDDAVQIDAVTLEGGGEYRIASGAIALAKEEARRVPAIVLGEEAADEAL